MIAISSNFSAKIALIRPANENAIDVNNTIAIVILKLCRFNSVKNNAKT